MSIVQKKSGHVYRCSPDLPEIIPQRTGCQYVYLCLLCLSRLSVPVYFVYCARVSALLQQSKPVSTHLRRLETHTKYYAATAGHRGIYIGLESCRNRCRLIGTACGLQDGGLTCLHTLPNIGVLNLNERLNYKFSKGTRIDTQTTWAMLIKANME